MNGTRVKKHKCESSVCCKTTHTGCVTYLEENGLSLCFFLLSRSVSPKSLVYFLSYELPQREDFTPVERGCYLQKATPFPSVPPSVSRPLLLLLWLDDNTASLPTVKGEQLISDKVQ